ncbi:MAG: DUF2235 domain-containing protein, partial [Vicinamibacterales bacterium]|nr:DUF2235 domain-containing protein [Vicinamibacterales bacterium]
MRRLVISCDGTWNDPADRTNVWKVREVVARTPEQPEPYYDPGVGTAVGDRILGGAFGDGLSRNIREAYRWLCKTYQDGDDLFLFGFSRGAFTVRSLAGFVRTIGLLPAGQLEAIDAGYDLYRSRVDKNNTKRIRDLQEFQAKYGSRPIEQI